MCCCCCCFCFITYSYPFRTFWPFSQLSLWKGFRCCFCVFSVCFCFRLIHRVLCFGCGRVVISRVCFKNVLYLTQKIKIKSNYTKNETSATVFACVCVVGIKIKDISKAHVQTQMEFERHNKNIIQLRISLSLL